jgi:hypothetical protein
VIRQIYIIDKTENNPIQVNGHPAWAVGMHPSRYYFRLWELTFSPEYDLDTDTVRAMDVVTNTFCAGGGVTADGVWVNLGGKLPSASAIVQSLNQESHRQPRSYMGWQHRY